MVDNIIPKKEEEKPYISVIITAFNRRDFLPRAIESVAKQTLSKDYYEVFVIKNFEDQLIDHLIDKYNFKSINLSTEEMKIIGKYVIDTVKKVNGKVICILEDDDYFFPERLEIILKEFKENENLGYFHNNLKFINEKGMDIKVFMQKQIDRDIILDKDRKNTFNFVKYLKYGINFNVSSMAIKKDIILQQEKILVNLRGSLDYFFFYSALLSDYDLMFSSKILTAYTVHESESHPYSEDMEDYYRKLENLLFKYMEISNLNLELTKGTPYEIFAHFEIFNDKVRLYMCNKKNKLDMRYVFKNVQKLLKYNKILSFKLLTYYFLSSIFPNFTKIIYYEIKMFAARNYKGEGR
ncbi:MAG: glycosyltransferase [Minisyncoccia bacterium]